MQQNVSISSNNVISGTLHYVEDYTGFSGDPELQEGNYLVLHFDTPNEPDATITVTVTNPSVLDEDGIIVLYIRDKSSQTVTVVAEKDGQTSETTYQLYGLTCEEKE